MVAPEHSFWPEVVNEQYTLNVLPETGKRRAHKLAYCRRLARNLAHFDKFPWLWGVGEPPQQSRINILPPELRQKILSEVIEGDELSFSVGSYYKKLRTVCKTFVGDMEKVRNEWDRRLAEQAAGHALSRASINHFIQDINTARECQAEALRLRNSALKAAKGGQKIRKNAGRKDEKIKHARGKGGAVVQQVQKTTKIKFNNSRLKYKGKKTKWV